MGGGYYRRVAHAVTTPVASEPRSPERDAYAEIAGFFDAFAPDEARWRRRNRGYYDLLTAIHRSIAPWASAGEYTSSSKLHFPLPA